MAASVFTKSFLLLFSGPIVWAIHFLFIYGLTGVVCARPDWNTSWLGLGLIEWGIAAAGLASLAVLAYLHGKGRRIDAAKASAVFVRRGGAWLAVLSALAIVLESLPVLLVAACA